MNEFKKLIDVKTIITFIITGVLAYLAIKGTITPDQFMVIVVMIFTYFFTKVSTPANTAVTTEIKSETKPVINNDK